MIKKVLMISDNDITSTESLGVTKKLLGQYKAFNNLGYDTYHLCFKDEEGVLIHGDDTKVLVKKQIKLYFTYIKLLSLAHKVCAENNIDLCYIRYPLADFAFMSMIKKLHKICKVVVEIPTYPYDNENIGNVSFITKFIFAQDLHNRYKLKKFVDLIANIGIDEYIYEIKCVNIFNSINVNNIKVRIAFPPDDILHIVSVALIRQDHRFDRFITGLYQYYQNKKKSDPEIIFDIVGNDVSGEKEELIKLTKKYNLEDKVLFHGIKFGDDLDLIFDSAHLAISTFNEKREIVGKTSVLKTREYCARGIPFISSLPDLAIPIELGFYKLVESSENPIDINEIIEFYQYIKAHPEIPKNMRKFAEENLTWEKQLKKVVDAIEN